MDQQTSHSAVSDGWWARIFNACIRTFHAYAGWLVSISWKRFFGMSLLLIIAMAILHDVPPLSWTYIEAVPTDAATSAHKSRKSMKLKLDALKKLKGIGESVDISINDNGVHITTRAKSAAPAASGAPLPASAAGGAGLTITLPSDADAKEVKESMEEARQELLAAVEEAKQEALDAIGEEEGPRIITHRYGDPLMPLTMWFILISIIIKITYKGKVQAEAKAAQATEVAESESLKRQVMEARMAAMQAQIEPHFLFNTLASIEHLIETDPPRAGRMQRNLIDLLRATMPSMREANAKTVRDLGRELAVIRPYLEILKVRMEERLQTEVLVSDGLLSAEFPPMMLQSLVENAIKHGLEPKADGGQLTVRAEIVHGNLAVNVTDTGVGFGKAATAGTGIGLSNIRERLALLYGNKASLAVSEPAGGGTSVTITVPYIAHTSAQT